MGKVFDLSGKDLTKTDATLRVPEAPADAAAVGKQNDAQTESLKAEKSRAEGAEKKLQQQVDTLNAGGLNLKEDLIRTQVDSYLTQHPEAMGTQGPKGDKGDKGDPGEGFTSTAKELMLSLFENASYKTSDAQDTLNALRVEWEDIPVQSVSLSSSTLTLNEGESKTLTATVLPANATDRTVVWSVSPTGFATVVNGEVTANKAGSCTVTATAGGKSASCAVTVAAVETAVLIYNMTTSTTLSSGFDTGLKLLEHAATETPQYTILLDLKPRDSFNSMTTTPQVLYCMKETAWKPAGINLGFDPNNGILPFIYYSKGGLSLCDTIEHFKMRTRYVIQIDGKNFRGGSTHIALSDWNTTMSALTDVPGSMIIGGARDATSDNIVQRLMATLYQCKVYKGLLSDAEVKAFIEEGTV